MSLDEYTIIAATLFLKALHIMRPNIGLLALVVLLIGVGHTFDIYSLAHIASSILVLSVVVTILLDELKGA